MFMTRPRVEVVVPFTPACPHRSAALRFVRTLYGRTITVALGDHPWCKAVPVNRAVEHSSAQVIVVADADVWTDGLDEAIEQVESGAPWAIPHSQVHRLTEEATQRVYNGEPFEGQETEQRPYLGIPGGGYVVAHREVLLSVPLDPRFVGWGQEDQSWACALGTLAGPPVRGSAPLYHLWHPPQKRMSRVIGSNEGWQLKRRYMKARHDPQAMRTLIEEARAHSANQPFLPDRPKVGVG